MKIERLPEPQTNTGCFAKTRTGRREAPRLGTKPKSWLCCAHCNQVREAGNPGEGRTKVMTVSGMAARTGVTGESTLQQLSADVAGPTLWDHRSKGYRVCGASALPFARGASRLV
jgi:hypothetical protein